MNFVIEKAEKECQALADSFASFQNQDRSRSSLIARMYEQQKKDYSALCKHVTASQLTIAKRPSNTSMTMNLGRPQPYCPMHTGVHQTSTQQRNK
jgi:hypothetical protein